MATADHLTKTRNLLSNTDVFESCTEERADTNLEFHKLSNVSIFAALLKEVPMGCKDILSPGPLLKNHSFKCLAFEDSTRKPYSDNLCVFRYVILHLHRNLRLEVETSMFFDLSLDIICGTDVAFFRGVCMEDNAAVEDIVQADFFMCDIDIADGSMIEELAWISVGNYPKTVQRLRFSSHICNVSSINARFKADPFPSCDQFINKVGNLGVHLTTCEDKHCLTN